MRKYNGKMYYTITEVAKMIGRTPLTVKRWYKWVQETGGMDHLPPLPEPILYSNRKIRIYAPEQVEQLEQFRDALYPGDMSEFNKQFRGQNAETLIIRREREEARKMFDL